MVAFFTENYYIYHYSNVCSNAFIFMVILILFSILLPFFTNLGVLDRFWKPIKIFNNHPIVQFNDEFLIELTFNDGVTSKLYTNHLLDKDTDVFIPFVNIENEDYNDKDIFNRITFKTNINNLHQRNPDSYVKEIKFYIFFDYYMTEDVNIHLRSKAHMFYSSNDPIKKFNSNGDLILKQNIGLTESYFMKNQGTGLSFEEEIDVISNDPFDRNDNYYFEYKKTDILVEKVETGTTNKILEIEININIPYYQEIIVELPNYTNLKNKWVLYSILFFPTVFVCYCLMEMVIKNQIFKTRIKSDIPIKL